MVSSFKNMTENLLDVQDQEIFIECAKNIIKQFPQAENWLLWWMQDGHSKMIFEAYREMDAKLWAAIPQDTNAEEAMHWKIYSALGKNHTVFMEGFEGLFRFVVHYEWLHTSAKNGVKIRYGRAQPWKRTTAMYGRSKRNRDPSYKRTKFVSDGRPPDTSKQLLPKKTTHRATPGPDSSPVKNTLVAAVRSKHGAIPSYIWFNNSCWFDIAMDLIFHAVTRNYSRAFAIALSGLQPDDPLAKLFEMIDNRRKLAENEDLSHAEISKQISIQHTEFREYLLSLEIVPESSNEGYDLFGWLSSLFRHRIKQFHQGAMSFFGATFFYLRQCPGDSTHAESHMQLRIPKQPMILMSITAALAEQYSGDLNNWFKNLLRIPSSAQQAKDNALARCWNNSESVICGGNAHSIRMIMTIPVVLIIIMEADEHDNKWTLPKILRPLDKDAEINQGVVYDIVGRGILDVDRAHFVSRFTTDQKIVYDYDGMQHRGCAMPNAELHYARDVAGKAIARNKGMTTSAVIYHLRGGLQAQEFFERNQSSLITKAFPHISFEKKPGDDFPTPVLSGTGISQIPSDDDVSKASPLQATITNYTQVKPIPVISKNHQKTPSRSPTKKLVTNQPFNDSFQVDSAHASSPTPPPAVVKKVLFEDSTQAVSAHVPAPTLSSALIKKAPQLPATPNPKKRAKRKNRSNDQPDDTAQPPATPKPRKRIKRKDRSSDQPDDLAQLPVTPDPSKRNKRKTCSNDQSDLIDSDEDLDSNEENRSPFRMHCRCGVSGNGHNQNGSTAGLDAIECSKCRKWSHIACQRDGRASKLPKNAKFSCDECIGWFPGFSKNGKSSQVKRASKPGLKPRKSSRQKTNPTPVWERLCAGKGALARHGKYWYPVRLLQKLKDSVWRVQWWRGCDWGHYDPPQFDAPVKQEDLVDELWQDRDARRKIRLGKWTHAEDIPEDEDILAYYQNVAFSQEIDEILAPHAQGLEKLLKFHCGDKSALDNAETIPALVFLHARPTRSREGNSIVDAGEVPYAIRAEIANWIHHKIPGAGTSIKRWVGTVVHAHAITIYIATTRKEKLVAKLVAEGLLNEDNIKEEVLWQAAWDYQCTNFLQTKEDIDRECLYAFESRLFENSITAGVAGNQQWGLDVGAVQGHWYPYPLIYNLGDRASVESESEVQPGDNFSEGSGAEEKDIKPKGPRPTPRPKRRKLA